MPSPHCRRAQLLLLQGKLPLAEEALLNQRLVWSAVDLHLRRFHWERALAVAQQAGDSRLVDAVLWHRCAPLTAKGYDHKTPLHTSSEAFEH